MKTPQWLNVAVTAITAALLPACDAFNLQELKPGITTAAEVRSRMGEPGMEFRNPDGSVTWEYTRQPQGIECYMITIGPDQILRSVEQVLTEANQARIVAGMDKDEVRRLLGMPGSKTSYPNLQEEVWDWRVAGMMPSEETHFHVHFDPATGLVRRTSRRVEARG
jgi:hypothetical protein